MAEVIHEVEAQLEPELRRSGSTLAITTEVGAVGAWDRFRLAQVVSNLLSNAIKFGLGRPIEIATSMVEGDARLVVTDHGAGISTALKERVFDPFERGVSVLHHGGLGLGLHIVREIVTALGGTVTVESTPNAGTSFEVRLPLGGPS
jgi:signal transduction histidine kinase